MKKIYAILLVAGFMLPVAVVAQDNPGKTKQKATAEQQVTTTVASADVKAKENRKQYKKYKKEMRQLEKKDPAPNVIRDRNIT